MTLRKITLFLVATVLTAGCNANAKSEWQLNLDKLADSQHGINVYFKYTEPIGSYEVTMLWQPFDSHSETGVIVANFRDTVTNESFQYYEREKYSSYHTDLITYGEGFEGHHDGDVHHISTATPEQEYFADSPLGYYDSFQLFDVDFDGADELLASDWYHGQQGNYYAVYEITPEGLVQRCEAPFAEIDNCTVFNAERGEVIVTTHDGFAHSTTHIYNVSGKETVLATIYEFTLHPIEGYDKMYDITLKLTEGNELRFEGSIGRTSSLYYDVTMFHPEAIDGFISAPYEMLFFADLDFDGTDEMITDLTPFAGSQRDCSAFTSIYRLVDGRYKSATKEFTAKCKVFEAIETPFFWINPATKEIIQYCDGGYMSGGWEVYVYDGKRYRYDRYVSFDRDIDQPMLTITITDPQGKLIREFRTSNDDFDKHQSEY